MRLIDTTCPHCGALLHPAADSNSMFCSHCGAELLIDDEKLHIVYDNAEAAGYQFEKGRQRAQAEARRKTASYNISNNRYNDRSNNRSMPKKKSRVWLWVIGWLVIFPIPLTILLKRNKRMNTVLKVGIIAIAWLIYFMIGLSGNNDSNSTGNNISSNSTVHTEVVGNSEEVQAPSDTATVKTEYNGNAMVDSFVSAFNEASDVDLVYVEEFVPSDKQNSHYRTEFRLDAYREATGKSYVYDGKTVDIVCHDNLLMDPSIRVYSFGLTFEQVTKLIEVSSCIMDTDISSSDVKSAIDYINEHHEANGYYYGELGLTVSGDEKTGYELMIKKD